MGIIKKQAQLHLVSNNPTDDDLRPFAEKFYQDRLRKHSDTPLTVKIILAASGMRDLLIMQWERKQALEADKAVTAAKEEAAEQEALIKAELALAQEELRMELDVPPDQLVAMSIEKWTVRYTQNKLDAAEMPRIDDQEGNSFNCCLAYLFDCCDGKTPVSLFAVADYKIVAGGAVLGICAKVAEVFAKQNEVLKSKRLQCTNSLAKAKEIVNSRRQNHTIFDYVNGYADYKVEDLPKARMNELGKHVCGLFTNCCNKQEEVQAWAQTEDGELFGVCQKALNVFRKVWNADKRNRLMFTHTVFAKAEEAVAKTKAHQQTFNRLVEYARQLAVWSLDFEQYPKLIEMDGTICCGVHGCPCGNKLVDDRGGFGTFVNDGVVKGICAMAGAAFNTVIASEGHSDQVRHMKWARDYKTAKWIATQNQTSQSDNSSSSSNRPDPSEARKAREKQEAEARQAREQEQQRRKELVSALKAKLREIDPEMSETAAETMANRLFKKYGGLTDITVIFRTAAINRMVAANGQMSDEHTARLYAKAAGVTDKEFDAVIKEHREHQAAKAQAESDGVAKEHDKKGFGEESAATVAARKPKKGC